MKKIITTIGNSYVIRLTAEEREAYNLEKGDIIDVELVKLPESEIRGDNANSRTLPTTHKAKKGGAV